MENNSESMAKIASIVENAPIAEILETIEVVAEFIPGIGNVAKVIIKVLRILLKVQPSVSQGLYSVADTQQNLFDMDNGRYLPFVPADDTPQLNVLRTMVDIAIEDGELTDEELNMLTQKAEMIGIDTDLFKIGIR